MLRCANCNGPVDKNATACPRCGRPKAGEEASRLQSGGCLVVVLAVAGFLAYSWITDGGDKTRPEAANVSAQVPQESKYQETESAEQDRALEHQRAVVDDRPSESEQVSPTASADTFTANAVLKDSRGKVVLQEGPRMTSKNVSVLPSGTPVKVETTNGKWIRVRTSDGLVGYVRERQLEFLRDGDQF